MTDQKKPELLSPAGSFDAVRAAVEGGCDAVYLGGRQFSARAFADNFSPAELAQVCDYCHLRGVKVYVTVNTLYKQPELTPLLDFVGQLWEMGADGLILQDLGAAQLIRQHFPGFPLHASTQMSAMSREDVHALAQNGFRTAILARELSLPEIEAITAAGEARIEVFVHGALCVCYSGQCLMSSFLGGRSGNRGLCAQPCRLPYHLYRGPEHLAEGHLLSPKDMAALPLLPALVQAGVDSLKIEGRMKSPEYVAGVTRIYRKYLDLACAAPDDYRVAEADWKELLQLFNRGGFSEGYFRAHSGRDMMAPERPKPWGLRIGQVSSYIPKIGRANIRTREALAPGDGLEIWTQTEPHPGAGVNQASRPGETIALRVSGDIEKNDPVYRTYDKTLMDELRRFLEKPARKQPVWGKLSLRPQKPAALTLWTEDGHLAHVTGEVATPAQKRPLAAEVAQAQLARMGDTPFALAGLELDNPGGLFLPMSALNALRRSAAEALSKTIVEKSKRPPVAVALPPAQPAPRVRDKALTALVSTPAQCEAACEARGLQTIYVEPTGALLAQLSDWVAAAHAQGKEIVCATPRLWRESAAATASARMEQAQRAGVDGFLARSAGALAHCQGLGPVMADFPLNIFNRESVEFWENQGVRRLCLSPEMTLDEIRTVANPACEALMYGHLPLMVTHQCPIGNFDGGKDHRTFCRDKGNAAGFVLRDRKGEAFPLLPDCDACTCTILNGKPLFLLKFLHEILDSPLGALRLQFTRETGERTAQMLQATAQVLADGRPGPLAQSLIQAAGPTITRGHFYRGVE